MSSKLPRLWDDSKAKGMTEAELLRYRSNLLGSDLRITNFGGGNTSAKVTEVDPLSGEKVKVLWVKGSGGDLGSIDMKGFATLYVEKLEALKKRYRGIQHEDEMVDLYNHATFNLNPRACSIDTPLHNFVPFAHVDHVHPDAVIAIAAAKNGQKITQEIYGDSVGWLDWQRPGFDLALKLEEAVKKNPKSKGLVLGGHGLFAWANTAKECYEVTLELIEKAMNYLESKKPAASFGGEKVKSLSAEARKEYAAKILPPLRGKVSANVRKVGHFNDSDTVLAFVNSKRAKELAYVGTSCPDHFLRTKIRPLFIEIDPAKVSAEDLLKQVDPLLENYRKEYAEYYNRCKNPSSPAMRDSDPVVLLIPGIGMLTFAADKATARISGEFYVNAINVMEGATNVTDYVGLPEQESFNIEYWALEEAKLQRMPKPKPLAGRIAFITGGAGGIGKATAHRLLKEGAVVVLADMDAKSLDEAVADFQKTYGKDTARGVVANVTDENSVINSLKQAVLEYAGIDILISNAGIASAAPFEETSLELWNKNISILATGYFLVSREGYKVLRSQGIDGSVVFVASKNGLVASPGASAYCTAKAAEIHLARCLAAEGAEHGIRVNVVNPDAVIRGSKIWQGDWKKERAAANKIEEDSVEEHYRKRSMLKRNVFPEDIAEGIYFFASEVSAKSTGNILNVDAGNLTAFTR